MEKLSHRDRIQAILEGQRPDRFAVSFWRHFYHLEDTAEGTAEAMVRFQKEFDWDFMKINPRADYHIEDWGLQQKYSKSEFVKHTKLAYPINGPADWLNIRPLPLDAPALAEHLKMVWLIRKQMPKELPLLMTVFTPLAIAGRMVEKNETLVEDLRTYPDTVLRALEAITDTFVRFVVELRNAGADGIFFATTQWASADTITWEEYQKFGVPFDLRVIQAAGSDALNLFHICSSNNYLRELAQIDYHSQLYNWDAADPSNVPLDRAGDLLPGKVLVGGVDHRGWLLHSDASEMSYLVGEMKKRYDPARVIIAPGCSIEPETPIENLRAIRELLDG